MASRARKLADFGDTTVKNETGTTYTLVLADGGEIVTLNNSSAITVTIPTNANVAFPIGTTVKLLQIGSGTVTVAGAGGVTVNGVTLSIAEQYGELFCRKIATNTWIVSGGSSAAAAVAYSSVASTGNVTLDLANSNYFDAGQLTANTTVTFGSHNETVKHFTYTFIPGYNNAESSTFDLDTWRYDFTEVRLGAGSRGCYNNDGTKFFYVGQGADSIFSVTLTKPYNLNYRTGDYEQRYVGSIEASPQTVQFNPDGTRMYFVGTSTDSIRQCVCSNAFSFTGISFTGTGTDIMSVSSQETGPTFFTFNDDGTFLYVSGFNGDDINEYSLSTAFDISTETFVGNYDPLLGPSGISGLMWNSDGTKSIASSGSSSQFSLTDLGMNLKQFTHTTPYRFSTGTVGAVASKPVPTRSGEIQRGILPITLGRVQVNGLESNLIFETGSPYIPSFATSFAGDVPPIYSRGFRHFLEFETHNGGSNYQLINHRKVVL